MLLVYRITVLLASLMITVGCGMTETATTPKAPAGAQRLADFAELDQARSNQVRLALTELERRFPSGAQVELQFWTLPPSQATRQSVREHYDAQAGWTAAPEQRTEAGPLLPEAQIYLAKPARQRLAVLWFPARSDLAADHAVLVVQRAELTTAR